MNPQGKIAVFDVGRVLFRWNLRYLFEKMIDDPEELDWFLDHVVTEQWHFRHDHGATLGEMLPARIRRYPAYALHIAAYAARFNETIPGPVVGVHALVHRLRARDVPLYCLTNFGDELFAQFRAGQPIFDLFEDIVVSGTEKVAKPDPAIYEILERRSQRRGAQIFFTDDNPANVKAARDRGWDAHLFTDADALESQLQQTGLL